MTSHAVDDWRMVDFADRQSCGPPYDPLSVGNASAVTNKLDIEIARRPSANLDYYRFAVMLNVLDMKNAVHESEQTGDAFAVVDQRFDYLCRARGRRGRTGNEVRAEMALFIVNEVKGNSHVPKNRGETVMAAGDEFFHDNALGF